MTKLVFSRGEIAGKPRQADRSGAKQLRHWNWRRWCLNAARRPLRTEPFVKTGGAACTVTYTFQRQHRFPMLLAHSIQNARCGHRRQPRCRRPNCWSDTSQGATDTASHSPILAETSDPIVLRPKGDTFMPASATTTTVGDEDYLRRTVTCEPLRFEPGPRSKRSNMGRGRRPVSHAEAPDQIPHGLLTVRVFRDWRAAAGCGRRPRTPPPARSRR